MTYLPEPSLNLDMGHQERSFRALNQPYAVVATLDVSHSGHPASRSAQSGSVRSVGAEVVRDADCPGLHGRQ